MMAIVSLVLLRRPDAMTWLQVLDTHSHLMFGASLMIVLFAIHPFTLNQFSSDRAGLTLQFLLPVSARELVRGKAIGGARIVPDGGHALRPGVSVGNWRWIARRMGDDSLWRPCDLRRGDADRRNPVRAVPGRRRHEQGGFRRQSACRGGADWDGGGGHGRVARAGDCSASDNVRRPTFSRAHGDDDLAGRGDGDRVVTCSARSRRL